MLRVTVVLAVLSAMAMAALVAAAAGEKSKDSASNSNIGVIRHVVLFKFKDGATPEQVKVVENAFRELPRKIPTIRGFEWGTNNSPEGLAQGFTHCFFLTFDDEKARDEYLPHPAHKEFGRSLGPILDKVLVVDYKAME